jgi:hypothetical protein
MGVNLALSELWGMLDVVGTVQRMWGNFTAGVDTLVRLAVFTETVVLCIRVRQEQQFASVFD